MTKSINEILAGEVSPSPRGAPMGMSNALDPEAPALRLERIRFVDGDYAPDGAYWGGGSPLWCAWNESNRIYVRGADRQRAKLEVEDIAPWAQIMSEEVAAWDLEGFIAGYLEAAVWSEADSLRGKTETEFRKADLEEMRADCVKFCAENAAHLARAEYGRPGHTDAEMAGHDFWLTRNHHGAGFWDGDLPDDVGKALTAAAQKYCERRLYLSRGKICVE